MVLSQDLKFKLKKLFKEEKFSEVEFLIEDAIKDEDKSAGILNLLGASKINRNKKDKINLISGLNDFEKGYLKEKETKNGLICLQNFIKTSVDLYDIDKSDLVLNKIFEHFNNAKIFWKKNKQNNKNDILINFDSYSSLSNKDSFIVKCTFQEEKNNGKKTKNNICI